MQNKIIDAFLCAVKIVLILRCLHLILPGDRNCLAVCLVTAKWSWSVLVVASVWGNTPGGRLSLQPVVPGDKQLCKGPRGTFSPGPVLGRSEAAMPTMLCSQK